MLSCCPPKDRVGLGINGRTSWLKNGGDPNYLTSPGDGPPSRRDFPPCFWWGIENWWWGWEVKKRNFLGSSVFLEFICDRNLELVVFCELNYLVCFCFFKFIYAAILSCNFNEPVTDLRSQGFKNSWTFGEHHSLIVLMDLSLSLSLSIICPLVN